MLGRRIQSATNSPTAAAIAGYAGQTYPGSFVPASEKGTTQAAIQQRASRMPTVSDASAPDRTVRLTCAAIRADAIDQGNIPISTIAG